MRDIKKGIHSGKVGCFTIRDGIVKRHESIAKAGEELGITTVPGSSIRKNFSKTGVYRPRSGGVAWLEKAEVPEEAKQAYSQFVKMRSRSSNDN